jgi:hypothetical protein
MCLSNLYLQWRWGVRLIRYIVDHAYNVKFHYIRNVCFWKCNFTDLTYLYNVFYRSNRCSDYLCKPGLQNLKFSPEMCWHQWNWRWRLVLQWGLWDQRVLRILLCHLKLGGDMVQCAMTEKCRGVQWYHRSCLSLQDDQALPGKCMWIYIYIKSSQWISLCVI